MVKFVEIPHASLLPGNEFSPRLIAENVPISQNRKIIHYLGVPTNGGTPIVGWFYKGKSDEKGDDFFGMPSILGNLRRKMGHISQKTRVLII